MNRKQVVVLLWAAVMSTGAFAWTFTGPPTAELDKGESAVGFSYSYEKLNFDFDFPVVGSNGLVDDVEVYRHYLNLGHGLAENLEINLLLGVTSHDIDASDLGTTSDFDGDFEFSWGFNAKYTFIEDEKIDWGVAYQMTWYEAEDIVEGPNDTVKVQDAYDIQISVGPTIDMGGWNLYGGLFYYMLDAELEIGGADLGDIEQDDEIGGFIGAQFEVMENADLTIEGAFGDENYGIGVGISWQF